MNKLLAVILALFCVNPAIADITDSISQYLTCDTTMTSGTVAIDTIGIKNATLMGGVATGQQGAVSESYGVDSSAAKRYINSTLSPNFFNHDQDFSVCSWVRQNTTTDVNGIFGIRNNAGNGIAIGRHSVYGLRPGVIVNGIWHLSNITNISSWSWYHMCLTKNWTGSNSEIKLYINGSMTNVSFNGTYSNTSLSPIYGGVGADTIYNDQHMNGSIDEVLAYNRTLSSTEISLIYQYGKNGSMLFLNLSITSVNCTSCNIPDGDTVSPYDTQDATPTFEFNTNRNANCRISDEEGSYSEMGSARDCLFGEGSTNHRCTLLVEDEIVYPDQSIYIGCTLTGGTALNLTTLSMNLTQIEYNRSMSLYRGIQASVIWPGAQTYSNQQVYLRALNGSQKLATVDWVASYGSQRWLLNYDNHTKAGLFNISPAVYVFEITGNVSYNNITQQVSAYINSTKN